MQPSDVSEVRTGGGLRWVVAAILIAGAAASVTAALAVRRTRQTLGETELRERAQERALAIERELQIVAEHVGSLAALYQTFGEIDRRHFSSFTTTMLDDHPTIQALGFNPVVTLEQRAAHEEAMRRSGFPDYRITERTVGGALVPAADREWYVAAGFLEPLSGNEEAVGYDIASDPIRRGAIERAAASGSAAITGRLRLVQEREGQFGALICAPIYHGPAPDTAELRRAALRGFAVGVIRYGEIVQIALRDRRPAGVQMVLLDASSGGHEERLHGELTDNAELEAFAHRFSVGDRRFVIRGDRSPVSPGAFDPLPLAVLVAGVLLTALIVAYVVWQNNINSRLLSVITQLERAEQRETIFGRMLDESHVELYVFDAATLHFVHVNHGARRNLGYSMEELRNMTPIDLKPRVDAATFAALTQPLRDGSRSKVIFTTVHQRKDGSEIDVEVHLQLSTFDGVPAFIAMILDVTKRRQIDEQLRQAQRMESLGTLAGGIAHDFNNVLTAIMGYAELSKDDVAQDARLARNFNEIMRASDRAREMVRRILTFSRQQKVERRAMSLTEVVAETLQLMRVSLPASIEIRQSLADDVTIEGDPAQIHQVLMNLCTNAGHAMRHGDGLLDVTVDTIDVTLADSFHYGELRVGRYARIRVHDSGQGIPPGIAERVFEPFFTTKQAEGSGMGLAVSHGIVTAHDGTIRLSSRPGDGTTFEVLLPLAEADECARRAEAAESPGGSENILLVDDEPAIVRLLDEALSRAGYNVESYTDPIAALASVRAQPDRFELVVTDYTMPHLGGVELAKLVREIAPELPLIIVSGFGETLDDEVLRNAGVVAVMAKPPRMAEVKALVRSVQDDKLKALV